MFFFWMSRNIYALEMKKKSKHVFCKGATRIFFYDKDVFNTNSYANTMILVDKFVGGLSRFGYDCYKIVGSHLNLENNQCNSLLQMFIE